MTLSRGTLELIGTMIQQVQITVGSPDFDDIAPRLILAKREIAQALQEPLDASE